MRRLRRARRADRGASVVEYALLAGAFSLVVVAGLGSIQKNFSTAYDDRQPQYGAPHATNQTTTTSFVATTITVLPVSSTTTTAVASSSTSSTVFSSTTTTTAPAVNQSYWWHTTEHRSGNKWRIVTGMYLLRTNGLPYANTSVTVSYFDINQFPIGQVSGTTNALGYLQLTSPEFKKATQARAFVAVTRVNGSTSWEGSLTAWVNKP